MEICDLTNEVEDPETMPLCPLCDQPIMDYEPVFIFSAHGVKALGHDYCVAELMKNDEEE